MTGDRDCTPRLRELMQAADLTSFAALRREAGVSTWPLRQLRRGCADRLRAGDLQQLAAALQQPLEQLLSEFGSRPVAPPPTTASDTAALRAEYQRLQQQLAEQAADLQVQFQRESLSTLEAFLLQWPTAAAAVAKNPQVPAPNLLPLIKPVEQLLARWGLEPIGSVGAEAAYDPQQHQLMQGQAQAGDRVRIRYVGYRHRGKLLHRARVSPSASGTN